MLINKTIGQLHYKGWIWRNTLSITPAFVNLSLACYILSVEALLTCLIRRKLLLLDADLFSMLPDLKTWDWHTFLTFLLCQHVIHDWSFYFIESRIVSQSAEQLFPAHMVSSGLSATPELKIPVGGSICKHSFYCHSGWAINTGGGKHTQTFLLLSLWMHFLSKLSDRETQRESKSLATSCSLSLQTSVHHRLNELY